MSDNSNYQYWNTTITKEIIEKIKDWIELDKLIYIKSIELKGVKQDKLKCENDILNYMQNEKVSGIDTWLGFKILLNKSKTKSSIQLNTVKECLWSIIWDDKILDELLEKIENNRKVNEKINLKKEN